MRLAVRRTNRRPLIVSYDRARRAEQRRWEQFFADQVPPLRTTDPVVRDTYYFAWQTFWANHCRGGRGVLRGPFTSAARLSYGSQWWWDQAFHAAILRHLRDPRLTYAEFENFWRAQQPDGSIVGALRFTLDDIAQHHAQFYRQTMRMQPPVIGAVLPLLREHPGWPRDLARWHAALSRHAAWHLRPERDTDHDGLAEYHHNIESSGDQNQRWDSQKLDPTKTIDHLRPTESVDYNVWLALLWQSLAEMAQQLDLLGGVALVTRLVLGQDLFYDVEHLFLAGDLGEDAQRPRHGFRRAKVAFDRGQGGPAFTLLGGIAGFDHRPGQRVAYQEKGIRRIIQEEGLSTTEIGRASCRERV